MAGEMFREALLKGQYPADTSDQTSGMVEERSHYVCIRVTKETRLYMTYHTRPIRTRC